MLENIIEIVCDQLCITRDNSNITKDTDIKNDLYADSLDMVELCMEIEDIYECEISDEELEKWVTIGDIVRFVEKL